METLTLTKTPETGARWPIGLKIVGGDLLLSGRFEQWVPLAISNEGDGEGAVQLVVDVTSHRAAKPGAEDPDLFSYASTRVERVGPQSYRLKGNLRAGEESAPVEALLQSPHAHTPFLVMTFSLDRNRFAPLWEALEGRAAATGEHEMRPRAWLVAPDLAAA